MPTGVTACLSMPNHIDHIASTVGMSLQAPCCQRSPPFVEILDECQLLKRGQCRCIFCEADGRVNADAGQPAAIKLLQQHFKAYRLDALVMPTTPAASRLGFQSFTCTAFNHVWPAAHAPDNLGCIKLFVPSHCTPLKAAQTLKLFNSVEWQNV